MNSFICSSCGKRMTDLASRGAKSMFEINICEDCKPLYIKDYRPYENNLTKENITLGISIGHYKEPLSYIIEALESIDRQSGVDFNKIKVVVITDKDGDFITNNIPMFKNISPEFIYLEEKGYNGGVRNKAIDVLDTDYIMFVDGDDYLLGQDTLSKILNGIQSKGCPDVFMTYFQEETYSGQTVLQDTICCIAMTHGKIYKKKFIKNSGLRFSSLVVGEDLEFNFLSCLKSNSFVFDTEIVSYFYRYNKNSLTRKDLKENIDSFLAVSPLVMELLRIFFDEWIKNGNSFAIDDFIGAVMQLFWFRYQIFAFQNAGDLTAYHDALFKLVNDYKQYINPEKAEFCCKLFSENIGATLVPITKIIQKNS